MIRLPDVTTLYVILAFAITYVILKRYLFGPLGAILDERERDERQAEALHAESLARLQRAMAEAEQGLAQARREGLKTREELRGQGPGAARSEARRSERRGGLGDRRCQPRDPEAVGGSLARASRAVEVARSNPGRENPRTKARGVRPSALPIAGSRRGTVLLGLPTPLLVLAAEEGAEHAGKVLGLPAWLWQLANLVLFFAVLIYFVARPLATAFRNRQLRVEESLNQARERRAEAAKFEAEIHERMGRLEREVAESGRRASPRGRTGGAPSSSAPTRRRIASAASRQEEIERRLAAAKAELREAAAGLTASGAKEILSREITEEDRRRLLSDSVTQLRDRNERRLHAPVRAGVPRVRAGGLRPRRFFAAAESLVAAVESNATLRAFLRTPPYPAKPRAARLRSCRARPASTITDRGSCRSC
jgi:F0F1-type ATP synthase membrane subunit b/b'